MTRVSAHESAAANSAAASHNRLCDPTKLGNPTRRKGPASKLIIKRKQLEPFQDVPVNVLEFRSHKNLTRGLLSMRRIHLFFLSLSLSTLTSVGMKSELGNKLVAVYTLVIFAHGSFSINP